MNILRHIKESLRNLRAAKLRSFLAILGILVGTGSVVALISSSQLATEHALAQFKTLGTNLLALNIQNDPSALAEHKNLPMHLTDIDALLQKIPTIENAAPYINGYFNVHYNDQLLQAQTIGATEALMDVAKIKLSAGRFVSALDKQTYYCVVGSQLASTLQQNAGNQTIIGSQLKLNDIYFTIIGIMAPWQTNLFMYVDLNQSVVIPINTAYLLSRYAQIQDVVFRLTPTANLEATQKIIQTTLTSLLPGETFSFRNPKQIIDIMAKQRSTFTWLLAMIGGISLLVGGIGVMNIMLVSVVERRREIGIRMAIGAKRKDIRRMFLMEAITLTVFGGLIGIILGSSIAFVLAEITHWGYQFYPLPPILGFVVSVIVGIISGYYPAYKASQLNPIEILQSD